jgi:hypothetical protein
VIFDVRDRLSESRAALESELRATLTALTASAQPALDMVRQARAGGSESIRQQVSRLDDALMRLNALG